MMEKILIRENFFNGQMVEADDLNRIGDQTGSAMAYLFAVSGGRWNFGLLADPLAPFDLSVSGNLLQLTGMAGITKSGRLIHQHPLWSPKVSLTLPSVPKHQAQWIFLDVRPGLMTWNGPDGETNGIHPRFRVPEYQLLITSSNENINPEQFPDALLIGQLLATNGEYSLSASFIPPCCHMGAHKLLLPLIARSVKAWERTVAATNKIIQKTELVPQNTPLGDLNRFASNLWSYAASRLPQLRSLDERSAPAELFLLWSGMANLFWMHVEEVTSWKKNFLGILDVNLRYLSGVAFDSRELILAAQNLAHGVYDHHALTSISAGIDKFINHVCNAWIFLGESDEIKDDILGQKPLKL